MLRITRLSGEDLASLPLAELSDVKALKQRLHKQHGLPPRFRQRLLHAGNALEDAVILTSVMESAGHEDTALSDSVKPDAVMNLQLLVLEFSEASDVQRTELGEAAGGAMVDEVGQFGIDQ